MNTTKSTAERDGEAVRIIRELAQQGASFSYLANALNWRGVPTPSGHGRWSERNVSRVAARNGVRVRFGVDARVCARVGVSAPVKPGQ